jgi:phosphoglucosamine mutase
VVATVMSNVGLETSLAGVGCNLVRTDVGDRSVVLEMDRGRYALGGEQSGHIIVRRGNRLIGDGLATTLHLLDALVSSEGPLSELSDCFQQSPQVLVNVRVTRKPNLENLPTVMTTIREVEAELGDAGRVLVRYSGTEPLLRVMVEGPDRKSTGGAANRIAAEIERKIGSSK